MYCSTCQQIIKNSEEIVCRRGYFWHLPCYVENSFPSNGKVIPESILTDDADSDEKS